jgi:hypothetical protein
MNAKDEEGEGMPVLRRRVRKRRVSRRASHTAPVRDPEATAKVPEAPKAKRVTCPYCGKWTRLNKLGLRSWHRGHRDFGKWCSGSRQVVTEIERSRRQ